MFFFKKSEGERIPNYAVAAILISTVALAVSIGTARWCWYIIDEQVRLRQDYLDLKSNMDQVNVQYEFWLKQLQTERKAYLDRQQPAASGQTK